MPRLLKSIFLVPFLLFFYSTFASAEEITVTTYYPSPYGSYKQLTADQIAIGSSYRNPTYADGTLYVYDKVGIGTNTPGSKLDVTSGSNSIKIDGLQISHANGRVYLAGNLHIDSYNGYDIFMNYYSQRGTRIYAGSGILTAYFDTNGNVGIGTLGPGAKLDVIGNIRSSTYVTANGLGEAYSGAGGMNANYYYSATNNSWFAYPGDNSNYIRGRTYIGNDTGVITTGGNVGIGTVSPQTAAPNSQPGNLDANDIYLRSTGKWLSQSLGGGCYVTYSGSCLSGFTNQGSLGSWGMCANSANKAYFSPPGVSTCAGSLGLTTVSTAYACCR